MFHVSLDVFAPKIRSDFNRHTSSLFIVERQEIYNFVKVLWIMKPKKQEIHYKVNKPSNQDIA